MLNTQFQTFSKNDITLLPRVMGTVAVIIAYMTIAGYQFIGGGRLLNIISNGANYTVLCRTYEPAVSL